LINASKLARMVEISRELNSTTDIDELLTLIIREAAALTGSEAASILLLDPRTRELRFKAASQMQPEMIDMPVPLENSIAGAILTSNEPLIIDDVSKDPRWNPNVSQAIEFRTHSILGVPMHDVEKPVGVLEALNKHEGAFTYEDVETLAILADLAGVAVEKARLIEQLRQAYDELNELDQTKTSFIALASHELRTPLSVILGYVSFLREDATAQTAEQLDFVMTAAIRLRSLIQDMLNFQYTDVGGDKLKLESVNCVDLLREITGGRDETAVAKQQTVTVHLPSSPITLLADVGMIEVVINNLLSNAIKFTPEGGHIEVTLEQRNDEVWITVSDDGIGIPKDKLDRIFTRFYQVEDHMRRHYEGLGLGLAIAKELVELHNGRIWIENKQPQGSKFFVVLPLSQNDH
jgi:signal transduction histidine kinase